ncbi:MAG: FkbM family methyltransferase [Alphaproteobacteria bacterium]
MTEKLLEQRYRMFLRAGDCVIDVGAADAVHTAAFAKLVGVAGKVLAVEPLCDDYETLGKVVRENPHVELAKVALSNYRGETSFVKWIGNLGYSGLKQRRIYKIDKWNKVKVPVRVETIDSLWGGYNIDYIKIDIEGGETDCIRGGLATIRRCRPIISFEHGPLGFSVYGHNGLEVVDELLSLDYSFFDIIGIALPDRNAFAYALSTSLVWDFWAVPRDKVPMFQGDMSMLIDLNGNA